MSQTTRVNDTPHLLDIYSCHRHLLESSVTQLDESCHRYLLESTFTRDVYSSRLSRNWMSHVTDIYFLLTFTRDIYSSRLSRNWMSHVTDIYSRHLLESSVTWLIQLRDHRAGTRARSRSDMTHFCSTQNYMWHADKHLLQSWCFPFVQNVTLLQDSHVYKAAPAVWNFRWRTFARVASQGCEDP